MTEEQAEALEDGLIEVIREGVRLFWQRLTGDGKPSAEADAITAAALKAALGQHIGICIKPEGLKPVLKDITRGLRQTAESTAAALTVIADDMARASIILKPSTEKH